MQLIIDKLNEERDLLVQQISDNDEAIINLDARRTQLVAQNDTAEENLTAVEAAVAVLGGKSKRRRKK